MVARDERRDKVARSIQQVSLVFETYIACVSRIEAVHVVDGSSDIEDPEDFSYESEALFD